MGEKPTAMYVHQELIPCHKGRCLAMSSDLHLEVRVYSVFIRLSYPAFLIFILYLNNIVWHELVHAAGRAADTGSAQSGPEQ